jgi:hypothetical protein
VSAARRYHAICPVQHFDASKWAGWSIVSKELLTHSAGVGAHVAEGRIDRAYPTRGTSTGVAREVYHLTRCA